MRSDMTPEPTSQEGTTALLTHEVIGSATAARTALLLHGIFGAGRNWRSFARDWVERCPSWRVVLVDLRNHGGSQGYASPHTLEACSRDLDLLDAHLGRPADAICGHSFGGKVAIVHAARRTAAGAPPDQLWILDSPPGRIDLGIDPEDTEAWRVLGAMRETTVPAPTRGEVISELVARAVPRPIATWLATNLVMKSGGFDWCYDLATLGEMLRDYFQIDGYELLDRLPESVEIHCVRGGRSDRWSGAELEALSAWEASGRIHHHLLPSAAHWLQVDDPAGLLDQMAPAFGG